MNELNGNARSRRERSTQREQPFALATRNALSVKGPKLDPVRPTINPIFTLFQSECLMSIARQIASIIALPLLLSLGACSGADSVATQSQAVAAQPAPQPARDPRHDRFIRRRAAAEEAARMQRGRQPQQQQAAPVASEYWYVAHSLEIDAMNASGFAGFNLDNKCSTPGSTSGCGIGDVASNMDLDQNSNSCSPGSNCQGCVDNIAPVIADALTASEGYDVRAGLSAAVNNGKAVWLMRLVAVDSLQNDTWVLLALYRGYSTSTGCGQLFSGSGQFVVSDTSLWIAGNANYPKWFGEGVISNGRFDIRFGTGGGQNQTGEVAFSEFVDVPETFELKTYQLQLRASLAWDGLSATYGNAGAWAPAEDFREAVSRAFPQARCTMDAIVHRAGDLPLQGACGGTYGSPVGAVGLGFRYALATAVITGTTPTPPLGLCGSPSP